MSYVELADTDGYEFACRPGIGKNHVGPRRKHGVLCGNLFTFYNDCIRLGNHSLKEETVCRRCVAIGRKRGIIEEGTGDAAE